MMRTISIFAVFFLMLLGAESYGEETPIVISFEVLEFDFTDSPELFDEYSKAFMLPQDVDLNKLKRSVPQRTLLSHTQAAMPGIQIEQTTEINDSRFDLKLSAGEPDKGSSKLEIEYSLTRNETDITSLKTTVSLKLGDKPIPLGGVMRDGRKTNAGLTMSFFLLQAKNCCS